MPMRRKPTNAAAVRTLKSYPPQMRTRAPHQVPLEGRKPRCWATITSRTRGAERSACGVTRKHRRASPRCPQRRGCSTCNLASARIAVCGPSPLAVRRCEPPGPPARSDAHCCKHDRSHGPTLADTGLSVTAGHHERADGTVNTVTPLAPAARETSWRRYGISRSMRPNLWTRPLLRCARRQRRAQFVQAATSASLCSSRAFRPQVAGASGPR